MFLPICLLFSPLGGRMWLRMRMGTFRVEGTGCRAKDPRDADAVAQIIHEANELNKSEPRPRVAAAAKWPNTYFWGPLRVA